MKTEIDHQEAQSLFPTAATLKTPGSSDRSSGGAILQERKKSPSTLNVVLLGIVAVVFAFISMDYVIIGKNDSARYMALTTNSTTNISLSKGCPEIKPMKFLPLMLVFTGGCSGSTATNHFIEEIVEAHGLEKYNRLKFWLSNVEKDGVVSKYRNPFYFELKEKMGEENNATKFELLMESVKLAKMESQKLNQLYYFKLHASTILTTKRREMADKIGVAYAGVYRENVLDRCICTTKDCFTETVGYPVYAHNGEKASICFDRRQKHDEKPIIVKFENPVECFKDSLKEQELIKRADFPSVSEESLFAFEYTEDEEAWEKSIAAWMKILRPFLSGALDENALITVLQKYRNSRAQLRPHRELVYNYDYLESEIQNTKWANYVRL
mmetsp:Transcript_20319/g.25678  ORF Transcript_20319/g.25678 Transcript_20319/m.25678 type:complete len:383 (-) Transcript_20319:23-1171(-)